MTLQEVLASPLGLREAVKKNEIGIDEVLGGFRNDGPLKSENLFGWLLRRKAANVKPPTNKNKKNKRKSRGKRKNADV